MEHYTAHQWAEPDAQKECAELRHLLKICDIATSPPSGAASQETWHKWARGDTGQLGAIDSLTGWAASNQIVIVRQTILQPTSDQHNQSARNTERLTALHTSLLSGKQKAGKIDGLNIAVDAEGNDVPECDKIRLEQHILKIVKKHGSEKGVGDTAYATTAAFHACMFKTSFFFLPVFSA